MMKVKISVSPAITIGSIIAIVISWNINHSILWAIVHGFCSWWYVVYWFFFLQ